MIASPLSLHLLRTVAASPTQVFDAWTTADQLKRWTCPDPNAEVSVNIDLRASGYYSIRMDAEGGPFTAQGTYRVVDRPRRIVYTWAWKEEAHPMQEETLVTVELVEAADGTEIRLAHEGFPTPGDRDGHEQGWKICLDRLAEWVTPR
ncbi:MAG: SRPBCC domain-containing protein [Gemmatimonadetes bacterium]|nr:SRPBCC domain-containing protein [Gemmatimonadota bacterium]MYB97134.1 SRPBCC domain-containing protein [Gemmatimonadota bacterium]MYI46107.1 SRPBCC domain-containing protein [Gemmatimonadota bacterium]